MKMQKLCSEELCHKLKTVSALFMIVIVIVSGYFFINYFQYGGSFEGSSLLDEHDPPEADRSVDIISVKDSETESRRVINEHLKIVLIVSLVLMFMLCTVGNLFTLVALSYVRGKYQDEFTTLKGACVLLLFQLSFCDLCYGTIGYTHFIHALLINHHDNPFKSGAGEYVCYFLALFRNIFAQVDFSTMGKIIAFHLDTYLLSFTYFRSYCILRLQTQTMFSM